MSEQEFIAKFAEIVEEDEENIEMSTQLDALEAWDSLARITFIVFATDVCKKRLDGGRVREAKTVRDLYKLVSD